MLAPCETIEKLYVADNIEISYEASAHILYCRWIGFQSSDIIMKSGAVILDIVKGGSINKVLNDNSLVDGSWWEAAVWAADVWFPQMNDAGLKHFAWILSKNIFTELSARRAMEPHQETVKSFYSCEEAYKWLSRNNDRKMECGFLTS